MSGQRDQSLVLRPYVPRLVVQWLRETPEAKFREVEGSLAFVDISGFTKLTERLAKRGKVGAEELNDILDRCFTDLLAVAYADGAGLIKWGGDAVLLLFTGENHGARAARAAYRMRKKLREIGKITTASGASRTCPPSPPSRPPTRSAWTSPRASRWRSGSTSWPGLPPPSTATSRW